MFTKHGLLLVFGKFRQVLDGFYDSGYYLLFLIYYWQVRVYNFGR